ncbi:hypothetical protein SETIT_8G029600v2 [Setaria italica]|uniref:Uncharacterized protein n=1 Tax=Setaria italica TaxID=4555 RepID=A0A368S5B5_SETIT|nr:hypothetical protein SETIT_8G029600v2 [Setaria italica]
MRINSRAGFRFFFPSQAPLPLVRAPPGPVPTRRCRCRSSVTPSTSSHPTAAPPATPRASSPCSRPSSPPHPASPSASSPPMRRSRRRSSAPSPCLLVRCLLAACPSCSPGPGPFPRA